MTLYCYRGDYMYLVYLFKEKSNNEVIYVGSSSRPSARLKEHNHQLNGMKKPNNIHKYMIEKGLKLYKDVSVEWVDCVDNKEEMLKLEEKYYYRYLKTIKNERPAEIRNGFYNPRKRKVKCINDGRIFKTVTDCAEYYGKGRTTIGNVCRKEKPYTWINEEKYFFEYVIE